jgi:hypothetical protein
MNVENAMRQAPMTIDFYLLKVIESIDDRFGAGYAKAHPELVAQLVIACTKDFDSVINHAEEKD